MYNNKKATRVFTFRFSGKRFKGNNAETKYHDAAIGKAMKLAKLQDSPGEWLSRIVFGETGKSDTIVVGVQFWANSPPEIKKFEEPATV